MNHPAKTPLPNLMTNPLIADLLSLVGSLSEGETLPMKADWKLHDSLYQQVCLTRSGPTRDALISLMQEQLELLAKTEEGFTQVLKSRTWDEVSQTPGYPELIFQTTGVIPTGKN